MVENAASPDEARESGNERVAIIIVNYRTPDLTKVCLSALQSERRSFSHLRVLVVDGGSADGSAHELSDAIAGPEFRDWVELLALPINGGFGWANNQAMQRLMASSEQPRYIHLLNPDAQIEPGAIRQLADYLEDHPQVGAVGSQLLEPNGSLSGSAFSFPSIRGEFSRGVRTGALERLLRVRPISSTPPNATSVDWVTGASVMLRVDALCEVGLFDEGIFLYHEEVELMWRMQRAGWSVATEPRSRVRHIGAAATQVYDRNMSERCHARVPAYFYRSRTRFFALTRGRTVAALAFAAWLLGHAVWSIRRLAGLARNSKPVSHQLRDHLLKACPRKHDSVRAVPGPEAPPTEAPAWMTNGWL